MWKAATDTALKPRIWVMISQCSMIAGQVTSLRLRSVKSDAGTHSYDAIESRLSRSLATGRTMDFQ